MLKALFELSDEQKNILEADGHQLVIGGPGSGKTTVSILKAEQIANSLCNGQKILFLSFARATVSRVLEAVEQHSNIKAETKKIIEVDTYHSFFWRVIKTHGYLLGLPRKLSILTPPAEAIALSSIRNRYGAESKLTAAQKEEKKFLEKEERLRLASAEGRICFDLFAGYVSSLLNGSNKIRKLISSAHPFIILDEFQDTSSEQWKVVKALGKESTLIALADPEQRIFDFIGADPERLNHFRAEFTSKEFDLQDANHRSQGTDIAIFGNDILKGTFRDSYTGISCATFPGNQNQAFAALKGHTLQSRKRLLDSGKTDWSLAVLVPTKKLMRQVSDSFRTQQLSMPTIRHTASIDMHGAILAAEILAYMLQPKKLIGDEELFLELLSNFFQGKGGDAPSKKDINEAAGIRKAYEKAKKCRSAGTPIPSNSIIIPILNGYNAIRGAALVGDPDSDWRMVRSTLADCECTRLQKVADEAKKFKIA